MARPINFFIALFLGVAGNAGADTVSIADFRKDALNQWQSESFKGETSYRIETIDGQSVLQAKAEAAASGLVKKINIDLQRTPFLNWRWRVEKPLPPHNEKTRQGDDFVARVYVVISGGLFFWRTKALNYVWSSEAPTEAHWANPFTDHAQMFALRNQQHKPGVWYTEKRNVREDLKQVFGEDIDHIDAVAVMTDTDNTRGVAEALYGNIFFSSK